MQDSRFKQPLALILLSRIRISRVLHLPMPKEGSYYVKQ